MRTTVHIGDPIQKEGKSLGRLISDLLAQALGERKAAKGSTRQSRWISRAMDARIDLADREALYAAMSQGPPPTEGVEAT